MSRVLRRTRVFDLSIVSILVGGAAVVAGFLWGLFPFVKGRYEACLYHLSPPAAFTMRYQEGITFPGAEVSIFPFGTQCTYVASSTGEKASSALSPWPTVCIVVGVITLVSGIVTASVIWRRVR